jgi:hypothetical protein
MISDNPTGGDNQQERPSYPTWLKEVPVDLGHWIAGFVDGEGSFNVPIRRERDRRLPWRVGLSFNVSQRGREAAELLEATFRVGTIRSRKDGVVYYEVTKPSDLEERVVPFFGYFPLRGSKAADLRRFEEILEFVRSGRHLCPQGIREVVAMRNGMNGGGKRHRSDREILIVLDDWESSEAIRKAP